MIERGALARAAPPLLIVALLLSACLPGTNDQLNVPGLAGDVAGFWRGLWQGLICPISFFVSLFTNDVNVYETHNNGGFYNVGFLLGLSICFGGSGHGSGRAWPRRRH